MEGREAKHVTLAKFTHNTQFSNRWAQVFKHEYVSLFWLRQNGCDEPKEVAEMQCTSCSDPLRGILSQCVVEGKITNAAKEVLNH